MKKNIFKKVDYGELNSRQKENYNFQKMSAKLAEYGYNCVRLTDDWQGADFIAIHIDGDSFLKIQLKGRLSFYKKYIGKNIWIAFRYKNRDNIDYYLYPHDILIKELLEIVNYFDSTSWKKEGGYSVGSINKTLLEKIEKYKM